MEAEAHTPPQQDEPGATGQTCNYSSEIAEKVMRFAARAENAADYIQGYFGSDTNYGNRLPFHKGGRAYNELRRDTDYMQPHHHARRLCNEIKALLDAAATGDEAMQDCYVKSGAGYLLSPAAKGATPQAMTDDYVEKLYTLSMQVLDYVKRYPSLPSCFAGHIRNANHTRVERLVTLEKELGLKEIPSLSAAWQQAKREERTSPDHAR